jgi:hypothetical protein
MTSTPMILFVFASATSSLSWGYFQRYAMKRPPIGVFNLWDVAFMLAAIVVVPLLYLVLPTWMVAGLLGLAALSILYMTFEPVLRRRALIWLIALLVVGSEIWIFFQSGATSQSLLIYNDMIQVLLVVGAVNLWAQSGMKARDAAILGAALLTYDLLFTSILTVMTALFNRVGVLPFAPLVALGTGRSWVGLGLGDLLMAAVFPLLIYKGYGRTAGVVALLLTLVAFAFVLYLPAVGAVTAPVPVMVVLGPLMVGQYVVWRHWRGVERTLFQYWQQEP